MLPFSQQPGLNGVTLQKKPSESKSPLLLPCWVLCFHYQLPPVGPSGGLQWARAEPKKGSVAELALEDLGIPTGESCQRGYSVSPSLCGCHDWMPVTGQHAQWEVIPEHQKKLQSLKEMLNLFFQLAVGRKSAPRNSLELFSFQDKPCNSASKLIHWVSMAPYYTPCFVSDSMERIGETRLQSAFLTAITVYSLNEALLEPKIPRDKMALLKTKHQVHGCSPLLCIYLI